MIVLIYLIYSYPIAPILVPVLIQVMNEFPDTAPPPSPPAPPEYPPGNKSHETLGPPACASDPRSPPLAACVRVVQALARLCIGIAAARIAAAPGITWRYPIFYSRVGR